MISSLLPFAISASLNGASWFSRASVGLGEAGVGRLTLSSRALAVPADASPSPSSFSSRLSALSFSGAQTAAEIAEDTTTTTTTTTATDNALTDNVVVNWLRDNLDKIVFLLIALVVTWILDRVVRRALRTVLDRSQIPSASIFINCARILLWFICLMVVLKPVFGVEPTTLLTALGVGGIALSFGLKDTISNMIGGFGLMMGKVVQPGDIITVSGYSGVVKDVTWRNTVVQSRDGNEFWIPNSVLNTAGLTKWKQANESMVTVPFTARGDVPVEKAGQEIAAAVEAATADMHLPDRPCVVRFTGFSAYGSEGEAVVFAKPGLIASAVRDRAARAMAGLGCLVADGASSVSVDRDAVPQEEAGGKG